MGLVNPMGDVRIAILNAESVMLRMAEALEAMAAAAEYLAERLVEVEATVKEPVAYVHNDEEECAPSAPPKGRIEQMPHHGLKVVDLDRDADRPEDR